MPISVSDFVQQHPSLKYLLFMGLLAGAAVPINFFGIKFRLGDLFFEPVRIVLSFFQIIITFEWFYILMWVVMIIIFIKGVDHGG